MFRTTITKQNIIKTAYEAFTQNINNKTTLCYRQITTLEKTRLTSNSHTNKEQNSDRTEKLADKEFLVRLKNDPDVFGKGLEKHVDDPGDIAEEKHFTEQPLPSRKLRTKAYADIIKKHIKQMKIKEAIDVIEVRMLKEDRVKPENYIYNLVLGACGRVGFTKKAFTLYNDMKKRGLAATGGTYTALFNACANSPWPETDGLTRASHLYDLMVEKGYEPNDTNYNAMIKAFGRCGDLKKAFELVDEMIYKKILIKDDTINFLLQACVSDKNAGFRHALLVWRKLVEKRIKPSVFTYNLMLRCVRDCELGDISVTEDVVAKILSNNNEKLLKVEEKACLMLPEGEISGNSKENHLELARRAMDLRPNLMTQIPRLGNIIALNEVKKPEERLLLIGGCKGFLEDMESRLISPDIKTFTLLLDVIPNSDAAEKELLISLEKFKVKPDLSFLNMLIKKRSMRFDYESAKDVVELMKQYKFRPNLITFGVLALGCETKEQALELLDEMKESKYRLNAEILGAMLRQATHQQNFGYVLEMMETCVREKVQPNKVFMKTLEDFKKHCRICLNKKEFSKKQEKSFSIFKARYKNWLQEVTVDDSEDSHPWQQFRQSSIGNENYIPKDSARFKARRTSLFKVKALPKPERIKRKPRKYFKTSPKQYKS